MAIPSTDIYTGYENRTPQINRVGFFPFPLHQDNQLLINNSGFQGYIPSARFAGGGAVTAISGCIGKGTYYPISGSLEQMCNLFWKVKTWLLDFQVSSIDGQIDFTLHKRLSTTDFGTYYPNAIPLTINTDGNTSFPSLLGQDYSGAYFAKDATHYFYELSQRQKGFSWGPSDTTWSWYRLAPSTANRTVSLKDSQAYQIQREVFGINIITSETLMSLDLMSPECLAPLYSYDFVTNIQSNKNFYIPLLYSGGAGKQEISSNEQLKTWWRDHSTNFFGAERSGEPLINKFGEETGYGFSLHPTGQIPLIYFQDYNVSGNPIFNPNYPQNYFPFTNFQCWVRGTTTNTASDDPFWQAIIGARQDAAQVLAGLSTNLSSPTINWAIMISSIQSKPTPFPLGNLTIFDPIQSGTRNTFKVPIFTNMNPTSAGALSITNATLSPYEYWSNEIYPISGIGFN